jgi:hypothetical protein
LATFSESTRPAERDIASACVYWRVRAASTNISQSKLCEENAMSDQPTARTPGAKRAAPGDYVFDPALKATA